MKKLLVALLTLLAPCWTAFGQQAGIVKNDVQIDGLDPGIKIFLREKMAQGNTRFANDNIVLFLHGATSPSTCDFDATMSALALSGHGLSQCTRLLFDPKRKAPISFLAQLAVKSSSRANFQTHLTSQYGVVRYWPIADIG